MCACASLEPPLFPAFSLARATPSNTAPSDPRARVLGLVRRRRVFSLPLPPIPRGRGEGREKSREKLSKKELGGSGRGEGGASSSDGTQAEPRLLCRTLNCRGTWPAPCLQAEAGRGGPLSPSSGRAGWRSRGILTWEGEWEDKAENQRYKVQASVLG